ncbi:MFS transporter [Ruegeria arenilitoris]|uniref:MFS transporter n=1 Tax=Ruegeria arenilitoris TaxID=1173585 RepID=UPI00147CFE47|nr:MFS transporter [Ruegeria arenilitoris]
MTKCGNNTTRFAFLAYSAFSNFGIGAYLVATTWGAVQTTGDARLAASIFLVSMALGIVFSNIAGLYSDVAGVRLQLYASNVARIAAGFILFLGTVTEGFLIVSLFAFTVVRSVGNAISLVAESVAFQKAFPKKIRFKRVAEFGIVKQISIAAGTGITGVMIVFWGLNSTVALLIAITFLQIPLISLFTIMGSTPEDNKQPKSEKLLRKWVAGVRYLTASRELVVAVIVLAAVYSVAQVTNILVPVFVMNDLSAGPDVYGMMEMLWSAGGTLILILARKFTTEGSPARVAMSLLIVTGLVMVAFSVLTKVEISLVLYFVLGGLFCLVRLLCDSKILIDTDTEYVGRVRAVNLILTNGIGVVIFALPWLVDTEFVASIYAVWGIGLVALSAILLVYLNLSPQYKRAEADSQ